MFRFYYLNVMLLKYETASHLTSFYLFISYNYSLRVTLTNNVFNEFKIEKRNIQAETQTTPKYNPANRFARTIQQSSPAAALSAHSQAVCLLSGCHICM